MPQTYILDCETLYSADDCAHCGTPKEAHFSQIRQCAPNIPAVYTPRGWEDKARLGLSIGCALPMQGLPIFFDLDALPAFLELMPLEARHWVSFNGTTFDWPLLAALADQAGVAPGLWEAFAALPHYDLLAAIWAMDPPSRYTKGVNSLDALAQANSLGVKRSSGAEAPREWRQRHYAKVVNYTLGDCAFTRELYRMVLRGEPITRGNGAAPVLLPLPPWEHAPCAK